MGEAKRRREQGFKPDKLPDRLIAAWNDDDSEKLEELLEELMKHQNPNEPLSRAIRKLPSDEVIGFNEHIFDMASNIHFPVRIDDGEITLSRVSLFTIVLHGPEDQIKNLATIANEITNQIRDSGYAHQNSNVILSFRDFAAFNVMNLSPCDIRRLAQSVIPMGQEGESFMKAINELWTPEEVNESDRTEIKVVTRMLIGCRHIVDRDGKAYDFVDPPSFHFSDDDDVDGMDEDTMALVFDKYFEEQSKARERFEFAVDSIFEQHGLDIIIDGPHTWTEGLAAFASIPLHALLALNSSVMGLDEFDAVVEAHVCQGRDMTIVAWITDKGEIIGPVDVPTGLFMYAREDFLGWMAEEFETVRLHNSLDSFMLAAGRRKLDG